MSPVLQRIEQTRDALVDALAERNWEAIGQLDLACRSCMEDVLSCLLYTSPSPRDRQKSRMPSSA